MECCLGVIIINIIVVVTLTMLTILFVLRLRKPIGMAMLTGSLCVWLLRGALPEIFGRSLLEVIYLPRTYELIFALYFVMCLEMQLRLSGAFKGTLSALENWFRSDRVSIAFMPAILGLLPSLGGAIFSAPMVNSLGDRLKISAEQKSVINFWYRHVAEYCSPIQPGLLVTAMILNVPLGILIGKLWVLSIVAVLLGWVFCIPRRDAQLSVPHNSNIDVKLDVKNMFFTLFPVLFNFLFVVIFKGNPAISMGIVVLLMFPLLAMDKRPVNVVKTFVGAFDYKLLLNVSCIVLFIQILTNTGALRDLVQVFAATALSPALIIALVSFVIGLLTGISQGHAAMIMPLVASMSPNDATLGALAFVCGVAGQMLTPTHLCLVVTVDYFKADLFKTLKPILVMQALLTLFFVFWQYVL